MQGHADSATHNTSISFQLNPKWASKPPAKTKTVDIALQKSSARLFTATQKKRDFRHGYTCLSANGPEKLRIRLNDSSYGASGFRVLGPEV